MNATLGEIRQQTPEIRKQADISDKSLRLSQRAFISIRGHLADFPHNAVFVVFENLGRLPARNPRANTVQIRFTGPKFVYSSEAFTPVYQDVFPNVVKRIRIRIVDLSDDERRQIESGMVILKIAGLITYEDGFGDTDHVPFCEIYDTKPQPSWTACNE